MKIVICGSGSFLKEMDEIKTILERWGHRIVMPVHLNYNIRQTDRKKYLTLKRGLGRRHFREIARSDAIIVANYAKNGVAGYIGANTLAEIALAWYFHKRIYILHPPTQEYLKDETESWQPIILEGKIEALK